MLKNIIDIIDTETASIDFEFLSDANSDRQLIDFAAQLRLSIKALEKAEKALTKELTGDAIFQGETDQGKSAQLRGVDFYAAVTETIRWTLDSKAVKEEFGEQWYDARCKSSVVRSVKYVAGERGEIDMIGQV